MNLMDRFGLQGYPQSVIEAEGTTYFMTLDESGKRLGIQGDASAFVGDHDDKNNLLLCPLTAENAAALRERLPWLNPQPVGLDSRSFGFGDRIGSATPGHIRAMRDTKTITPIFAQQSIRENARIGRTVQQVVDNAMWGIFQEGWRDPWGADADHLKTTDDVDICVAAGYTFYTVDPSDHVDDSADSASLAELQQRAATLPWDQLDDSVVDMRARYLDKHFDVESFTLEFDEHALLRAACKYGRALAHTTRIFRHLVAVAGDQPFELEVSVDETETPTSPLEHYFIANELGRLGVPFISLAPRFVGRFEKAVDYIGDVKEYEAHVIKHAAIAHTLGPYKLSLHSGSDKFTIYPIVAKHAGGLIHVKTAGTSYLEALRVIARVQPSFFREILALAHQRYAEDKATYHVSADPKKVPSPDQLPDDQLPEILDWFDSRQMLHIVFGSVLDQYMNRIREVLDAHEEAHYQGLKAHFDKHLAPFR
jgi:hypothetical protein